MSRLLRLLFLLLLCFPGLVQARETPDYLVLLKGPYLEQGLPFFPRDLSIYFRSVYSFGNEQFEVIYLDRVLEEAGNWPQGECSVPVKVFTFHGTEYLYRAFGRNKSLLYAVGGEGSDYICSLIPAFERRFAYFLGTTPEWLLPPFPAIVEL